jgi:sugar lactone lactonase YvrE
VEIVVRANAKLAEGPRWDAARRRLLWVDIEGCALHVLERDEDRAITLPAMVGACAPADDGRVLVALADRLALLDLETEALEQVAAFPHGAGVRANDGVCDDAGTFWIGTMALDQRPGGGALYRFDGELTRILEAVTISNGIGWLRDGRMLYVDSPTRRVDVLDGTERTPWAQVEGGLPDGLAVDDEDGVWVAVHGGGAVHRYVDGTLDHVLRVPVDDVTACAFGGDDGRTLFVTGGGNLWSVRPGVSGKPAHAFHTGYGSRTAPSDAEDTSAR